MNVKHNEQNSNGNIPLEWISAKLTNVSFKSSLSLMSGEHQVTFTLRYGFHPAASDSYLDLAFLIVGKKLAQWNSKKL